jgi:hypothetical protein
LQVITAAASGGNLDILQYCIGLLDNGLDIAELRTNSDVCIKAAEHGHLELLQWAKSKGCYWPAASMFPAAAKFGNDDINEWLLKLQCPFEEERSFMNACKRGYFEFVKFARANGSKVWNIFQLRLHPAIIALREKVKNAPKDKIFEFDLTYITSRGNWYYTSWKGDAMKSGGIATNIGVHFYDMLSWIFGDVKENKVHVHTHDRAAGLLEFDKAKVRWFLSINEDTLPDEAKAAGKRTFRSMNIEGEEIEFSDGFTDLHTKSYENIINGNGFGLDEAYPSIRIVHDIRHAKPVGLVGDYHPFAKKDLSKHPFGY